VTASSPGRRLLRGGLLLGGGLLRRRLRGGGRIRLVLAAVGPGLLHDLQDARRPERFDEERPDLPQGEALVAVLADELGELEGDERPLADDAPPAGAERRREQAAGHPLEQRLLVDARGLGDRRVST